MDKNNIKILPDGRMDTANAALYTGLTQSTLAVFRCEGTGPKFIKRGRIFYYKDDLDEWINKDGKFSSTSQAQNDNRRSNY